MECKHIFAELHNVDVLIEMRDDLSCLYRVKLLQLCHVRSRRVPSLIKRLFWTHLHLALQSILRVGLT